MHSGNSSPSKPTFPTGGGSLSCVATLAPPLSKLGDGSLALVYREPQPAWQVTFSRDGQYLAVCYGSPNPCVRLWKCNNNKTFTLEHTLHGIQTRTIRSIAFAPIPNPYTLAAASFDGTIALWEQQQPDKNDWDCIAQLEGHDSEVKCVCWNATGSLLATCGRDKSVWIWECFLRNTIGSSSAHGDFECLAVLNGHSADVKCCVFAASHSSWGDGDEILLSSSYDDTIKVWAEDAGDWYCAASIGSVHSSTIWSLTVAPSNVRMVSGSDDGSLAIYKCYTTTEKVEQFPEQEKSSDGLWKCVGKLPDAHSSTIYSVHYASARCGHGRIVSGGADNRIQVYREARESTSDHPLFVVDAAATTDHGDVNCVCWHPTDGSVVVSAGDDGLVRIWKYSTS